jgi:hypothetical protein
MRKRVMTVAAAIATTVALAVIPSAAIAKSCGPGDVHGVIGGAQKCLADGEFCSHSEASQYHRYGFNCVLYPSGYYHLKRRD